MCTGHFPVCGKMLLLFYPLEGLEVFCEHHPASQTLVAWKRSIAHGHNCRLCNLGHLNTPLPFSRSPLSTKAEEAYSTNSFPAVYFSYRLSFNIRDENILLSEREVQLVGGCMDEYR